MNRTIIALAVGAVLGAAICGAVVLGTAGKRAGSPPQSRMDLELQKAAIMQLPLVRKFLRVFPDASFAREVTKEGRGSCRFIALSSRTRDRFILCILPDFVETPDGIRFDGAPTIRRHELVIEADSIQAGPGTEVTGKQIDRVLRARESLFGLRGGLHVVRVRTRPSGRPAAPPKTAPAE